MAGEPQDISPSAGMGCGVVRVAAVQMVSARDVAGNLAQAEPMIAEAARAAAKLVLLPEYFGVLGRRASDKLAVQEVDGDGPQQAFLARLAREYAITLVGGCVPLRGADPRRVRSACLVYGPDGKRLARYDKMHLFRYRGEGGESYDESRTIEAGSAVAAFDSPCGRVGLSICYDVRFPELYRALGEIALILVPAAFTYPTGLAHWDLLLRTRAVENQCYLLAAAQGGVHENGRRTFGHSMLVDPWGEVVAQRAEGPGIVVGDVDPSRIAKVRTQLPALADRVLPCGGASC
jgi:predicted amidohydrolase